MKRASCIEGHEKRHVLLPDFNRAITTTDTGVDQGDLKKRIREIARGRVRYRYRWICFLLRREGWQLRNDRQNAGQSNETWAKDFVHDELVRGRRLRIPTITDTFSRFSQATDPWVSYCGEDMARGLESVCQEIGYRKTIRVDQGSGFISRDLDLWARQNGIVLDFSRPGEPTDEAFMESFNGKFRAECLNTQWFISLDDARSKMEDWRRDYNEVRPHSAIGNKRPISLFHGTEAVVPP